MSGRCLREEPAAKLLAISKQKKRELEPKDALSQK